MNQPAVPPEEKAPWRRWFWPVGIAVWFIVGVYAGVRYEDHVEHTVEGVIILAAAVAYAWLSHREHPAEETRRSDDLAMVALLMVMALCSFIRATALPENTKLAICFAVLLVVGVAVVRGARPRRTRE